MKSIHVFIISWVGQHERAIAIFNIINTFTNNVTIVYSDPDPNYAIDIGSGHIKRPNQLFWGDKFKACIDACDADLMLVIHADCESDAWEEIVRRCQSICSQRPFIGVWAPIISGTPYNIEKTYICSLDADSLIMVADTDALVFCLARVVVERMKMVHYESNLYGWGINGMFVASAFVMKLLVVVDQKCAVRHREGRGYNAKSAKLQKNQFLQQMTVEERFRHLNLRTYMAQR